MRTSLKVSGSVILLSVLAGCATQSDHPSALLTPKSDGVLTAQEYNFARQIVRSEIGREGAILTSATVTLIDATTIDSSIGYRCPSGLLLQIKLIGDFPHTLTTGHPVFSGDPTPDFTIHAVNLTVGANTGQVCLMGVQTGKVAPEPGAVSLPIK